MNGTSCPGPCAVLINKCFRYGEKGNAYQINGCHIAGDIGTGQPAPWKTKSGFKTSSAFTAVHGKEVKVLLLVPRSGKRI